MSQMKRTLLNHTGYSNWSFTSCLNPFTILWFMTCTNLWESTLSTAVLEKSEMLAKASPWRMSEGKSFWWPAFNFLPIKKSRTKEILKTNPRPNWKKYKKKKISTTSTPKESRMSSTFIFLILTANSKKTNKSSFKSSTNGSAIEPKLKSNKYQNLSCSLLQPL